MAGLCRSTCSSNTILIFTEEGSWAFDCVHSRLGQPNRCHGLVPWFVTIVATRRTGFIRKMPWACTMVTHVDCSINVGSPQRESPRGKPVAFEDLRGSLLAAIMKLHRASLWYLQRPKTKDQRPKTKDQKLKTKNHHWSHPTCSLNASMQ